MYSRSDDLIYGGRFERLPLKYAHGTELQELYPGQ